MTSRLTTKNFPAVAAPPMRRMIGPAVTLSASAGTARPVAANVPNDAESWTSGRSVSMPAFPNDWTETWKPEPRARRPRAVRGAARQQLELLEAQRPPTPFVVGRVGGRRRGRDRSRVRTWIALHGDVDRRRRRAGRHLDEPGAVDHWKTRLHEPAPRRQSGGAYTNGSLTGPEPDPPPADATLCVAARQFSIAGCANEREDGSCPRSSAL